MLVVLELLYADAEPCVRVLESPMTLVIPAPALVFTGNVELDLLDGAWGRRKGVTGKIG